MSDDVKNDGVQSFLDGVEEEGGANSYASSVDASSWTDDTKLVVHAASRHGGGNPHDLNEVNPGLGVQKAFFVSDHATPIDVQVTGEVGVYENSYKNTSYYASVGVQAKVDMGNHFHVSAGVSVSGVTGYEEQLGKTVQPAGQFTVEAGRGDYAVRVGVSPETEITPSLTTLSFTKDFVSHRF